MARATYIYNAYFDVPFATFTVKHEMITWLERRPDLVPHLTISRTPDGPFNASVPVPSMSAEAFLENGGKF